MSHRKEVKAKKGRWVVRTQREICEFFNASIHAVRKWAESGMPGGSGAYDLAEITRWKIELGRAPQHRPQNEDLRRQLLAAQTKERAAKAELVQLRLAFERGEYLPRTEIEEWDRARSAVVKRGLLGLGRALAPLLVGLQAREIQAVVNKQTRGLLTRFASFTKEERKRMGE